MAAEVLMLRRMAALLGLLILVATRADAVETVKPVSFIDVHVDDGLWLDRLEVRGAGFAGVRPCVRFSDVVNGL